MSLYWKANDESEQPHFMDTCLMQVKAEKPAWYLGVVAGAVLKTMDVVASGSAEYLGYLEKGQLPPARLSLTSFQHILVLEGLFWSL